MPTVLDLLHLPVPSLDGISIVEIMHGRRRARLEAYAESLYPQRHGWAPLFSLRDDRFKFIDAPSPELYDLQRDPFEQRNLFEQRQELAVALRPRVRAQLARPLPDGVGIPDDDLRARLAALGYTAGGVPLMPATGAHLPDPKTCTGVFDFGRCK